jgi:gliding motility-associated-like protein
MALRTTLYIFNLISVTVLFLPKASSAQDSLLHLISHTSSGNSLEFVSNQGQFRDTHGAPRPDLLFKAVSEDADIFLRKQGISYVWTQEKPGPKESANTTSRTKEHIPNEVFTSRLDIDFIGSSESPLVTFSEHGEGVSNYYYSYCPDGVTGNAGYKQVNYTGIYPGIDVIYYGKKAKGLKYDIVVNPGAEVAAIQMAYKGADKIQVTEGRLQVSCGNGNLGEYLPKIFQEIEGKTFEIGGHYVLKYKDGISVVCFEVGNYNKSFPLVIDPWATYCGGTKADYSYAVAIDALGNIIITGSTVSTDFPVSVGAYQTIYKGTKENIFIAKFSATGTHLWSTYYGSNDIAYGVAVDALNNVIITGITYSNGFPASPGAYQTNTKGANDAILAKFDPSGLRLWATYYGGVSNEIGNSLTVDRNNNIAITGATNSLNLPITSGAYQPSYQGGTTDGDAYVAEFSPTGNLIWSTYYGGPHNESGYDIASDSQNNIIITGYTDSTNFPVSSGAYQTVFAGGSGDAFVVKFNSSGARQWATLFGGKGFDVASGLAVDGKDNIAFTGNSGSVNFPITPGAYQTSLTCGQGFLTKLNPAGGLIWSTYNNVNGSIYGEYTIAVDEHNSFYLLDEVSSAGAQPLSSCSLQPVPGGANDFYISRFDSSGRYSCSTYIGGPGSEDLNTYSHAIAVRQGKLCLSAFTSGNFPVTPGAFQDTCSQGPSIAHPFIVSLCSFICNDTSAITSQKIDFTASETTLLCSGSTVFSLLTTPNSCDTSGESVSYHWTFSGGSPASSGSEMPPTIFYSKPGKYSVSITINDVCSSISISKSDFIVVKDPTIDGLVQVPNIFTPNNDGNNDVFALHIDSTAILTESNLFIYNRWGNLLYRTSDLNKSWDGTYMGKSVPDGAYYWVLNYRLATGYCGEKKEITEKGFVTLLR